MFPPNKSRTFAKMSEESTARSPKPFLKLQVNVASVFLQKTAEVSLRRSRFLENCVVALQIRFDFGNAFCLLSSLSLSLLILGAPIRLNIYNGCGWSDVQKSAQMQIG